MKDRSLALFFRSETKQERAPRVELTRSPSRRRMTGICAFETWADVSGRREADIAFASTGSQFGCLTF
jgi:hypothetical protein